MEPDEIKDEMPSLCAGYQEAIVQTLRIKTEEIIEKILHKSLKNFGTPIVIGGVACNSRLKEVMNKHFKNVHVVNPLYSTDNAGMGGQLGSESSQLKDIFSRMLGARCS